MPDEVVLSFAGKIAHQIGKVLSGQGKNRRWRNEPHDLLHAIHENPPELVKEKSIVRLEDGLGSANDVYVGSHDMMKNYVKFPFGRDPEEAKKEAQSELGAYTVLSSLGFRVPHTSIVTDSRQRLGVLSRQIGEGGMEAQHPYDLAPEHADWNENAPHPSDSFYQPLAAVIGLDNDRHDGNILCDEHGRRWDFDFGTGDGGAWILGGLQPQHVMTIKRNIQDMLENEGKRVPGAHQAILDSVKKLTDPEMDKKFDWLKTAPQHAYRAVGAHQPHDSVVRSMALLRPELHKILANN